MRPTNYDATLLNICIGQKNLKMNEDLKELLELYNRNRHFLFGKKCEALNLDASTQELLKSCFGKYGIYIEMAGCPDCYDKCDYYQKDDPYCKRRCPIC